MKLTKYKRELLRMKFGECCAYCGNELPSSGWHAEDIGNEYVEGGLAAICTECRITKGRATTEGFRLMLSEQVERAQRNSLNFRTALRFGLVSATATPVVFWFERYDANTVSATQLLSHTSFPQDSAA